MSQPILCYVTDRKLLPLKEAVSDSTHLLREQIGKAAAGGIDWIQIREKDLDSRILLDLAKSVTTEIGRVNSACRIIINDRLDIASAAHAHGVHLGESALPVKMASKWRGQEGRRSFMIGASCHSRVQAKQAEEDGADYVFFGPVFHTPSKERFGAPQGLDKLGEVCRAVRIPVLAIGGVTADNACKCIEAGASGIAAIRLFQNSPNIAQLKARMSVKGC